MGNERERIATGVRSVQAVRVWAARERWGLREQA